MGAKGRIRVVGPLAGWGLEQGVALRRCFWGLFLSGGGLYRVCEYCTDDTYSILPFFSYDCSNLGDLDLDLLCLGSLT